MAVVVAMTVQLPVVAGMKFMLVVVVMVFAMAVRM
jgi:hypothetical protein